jgi:hypothetical protein
MIISEKQVMLLMTIARSYMTDLQMLNKRKGTQEDIASLLDQINNQQSDELREVK